MQKQEVTILSAELSGFQALAENLPPEEITPLMSEIHALVENTARLHQGIINRYTGDTFLAVFHTSKNAARNALDAAFELKDQLDSFVSDKKLEQPLNLKIGIASGGIIETDFGIEQKQQKTLMGDAVNHAMRISRFAQEGQILADDLTLVDLKDDFEFQKLEPIPLIGGTETLPVFELFGRKRKKLNLKVSGERKIASEMVGRSREMEQLEHFFKQLLAGNGSVVNIVGKAGIGKSRLVAEMKVQPFMEKVLLLEGRASSAGQNLSFHPITNLIKSWAGITENDLPSLSSKKLFEGIKRNTSEQADEIYPFLAIMMGLPLEGKYKERVKNIEGEALEKLILKNLRDLIIAATKDKPRIYLIEDMHWSDSSSITFFESLYKLSQKYPVMFINVMRPGYKDTGDYILKHLVDNFPGDHVTINVSPLENADSGLLISNLVHNIKLPEGINEMIIRKSEGNPFFIEEIIRSFLDDGIIEIHEKEFRVTEKIKDINIPETINDVILSRVDKLDEKTKELLKTASVIGRNFYFKVLEEAADTIGELDSRLEYLKDVQLIGESKKKDEIEYLFKHALAQQATYDSILLESKKELHLKIARSIEKVFSENLNEFYGTLAYHYEKAENLEKTEDYLVLAGDEAMRSGASSEAIQFFEKVLKVIINNANAHNNPKKVADIEEKLAYAHYAQGQNIKAAEIFDKVLSTYHLSKIPENKLLVILKVLRSLIRLYLNLKYWKVQQYQKNDNENDRIFKLILFRAEAYASFSPKDASISTLVIINSFSFSKLISSDYGIGILLTISIVFPWSGRGLGFARMTNNFVRTFIEIKDSIIWSTSRYSQAIFDYLVGQLSSDSDDDEVFKRSMETGRVWPPTVHHAFKGVGYIELGMKMETEHLLENLLKMADDLEHSFTRTQYYRLQQTYFLKYRKLDKVIINSEEIIHYIRKTDHAVILLLVFCLTSMAYALQGDVEKARQHYMDAEILSKKLWLKYYLSMTLMAKAYTEFAELKYRGDLQTNDKKTEFLKTSKLLADVSEKVNCNKTEAYRIRALAFAMNNQSSKALKYFQKSIVFAEWYGAKLELSRTYFELGKFLSDPKTKQKQLNGLSGKDYFDKAKAMFEEMDLQWDLEEYGKFVGKG